MSSFDLSNGGVATPMCNTWVNGIFVGVAPCQEQYMVPASPYGGPGYVPHPFITNSNGQR